MRSCHRDRWIAGGSLSLARIPHRKGVGSLRVAERLGVVNVVALLYVFTSGLAFGEESRSPQEEGEIDIWGVPCTVAGGPEGECWGQEKRTSGDGCAAQGVYAVQGLQGCYNAAEWMANPNLHRTLCDWPHSQRLIEDSLYLFRICDSRLVAVIPPGGEFKPEEWAWKCSSRDYPPPADCLTPNVDPPEPPDCTSEADAVAESHRNKEEKYEDWQNAYGAMVAASLAVGAACTPPPEPAGCMISLVAYYQAVESHTTAITRYLEALITHNVNIRNLEACATQ